jgi:hypothetical protein
MDKKILNSWPRLLKSGHIIYFNLVQSQKQNLEHPKNPMVCHHFPYEHGNLGDMFPHVHTSVLRISPSPWLKHVSRSPHLQEDQDSGRWSHRLAVPENQQKY